MSARDTPIEDRIDEAIHDLLDYMGNENEYNDNYKSMVTHFTKVMELRQKGSDSKNANEIKLQELQQQLSISEATNAIKLQELQQQKNLSVESHGLKVMELEQQKILSDDANAIKLEELALKKTITKETWLTVGTHVAGLIVLMNHERAHVIASKAFGLVKKIF
jgi:hypothetical protein